MAFVAGPIMGEGPLRGIVLLDVRTKKEGENLVADDRFVEAGALIAEVRPWFGAKGIAQKAPKFMDLSPDWLGLLKRPPDASALSKEDSTKIQDGNLANINKMAEEGALIWAGPFEEDTPLRGVFIFRNLPKDRVLEIAGRDHAIQPKRLDRELYPWLTSKGSWPEAAKSGS